MWKPPEQNIFFLETCFAYPISEQKFTVCSSRKHFLAALLALMFNKKVLIASHVLGFVFEHNCNETHFVDALNKIRHTEERNPA